MAKSKSKSKANTKVITVDATQRREIKKAADAGYKSHGIPGAWDAVDDVKEQLKGQGISVQDDDGEWSDIEANQVSEAIERKASEIKVDMLVRDVKRRAPSNVSKKKIERYASIVESEGVDALDGIFDSKNKKEGKLKEVFNDVFRREQGFASVDPKVKLNHSNEPLGEGDFVADNYRRERARKIADQETKINILMN